VGGVLGTVGLTAIEATGFRSLVQLFFSGCHICTCVSLCSKGGGWLADTFCFGIEYKRGGGGQVSKHRSVVTGKSLVPNPVMSEVLSKHSLFPSLPFPSHVIII
jgi:hypothetical protein